MRSQRKKLEEDEQLEGKTVDQVGGACMEAEKESELFS